MTTFVIIVLSLLCILLGVACFLLYKLVKVQLKKVEMYEAWVVSVRENVHDVYKEMISLDDKEWFRKDEDVGSVFSDLVELIDCLDQRVTDVD